MVIIDDSYTVLNEKYRGRKPKFGLEKDGVKYIFKYGACNFEIFSELIAEQLGIQMGIEMAHYVAAEYKGVVGVLTTNFKKEGELIVSSDKLRSYANELLQENNFQCEITHNSIEDIVQAAWAYDQRMRRDKLAEELMKRWVFAGAIMESDKNETNISLLKSTKVIRLTPDYDNSTMCQLNKNVLNFMDNFQTQGDIDVYIDQIGCQLHLSSRTMDMSFIEEFEYFVVHYPDVAKKVMASLKKLNVDKAIDKVVSDNDVYIDYKLSFWIRKLINSRLSMMNYIYQKYMMPQEEKKIKGN